MFKRTYTSEKTMATYDFKGILTLVTGGGSGIGRTVVKAFAKAGAFVVAADINLKGAEETLQEIENPSNHLAVKVDVSVESSIKELSNAITFKYNKSPSVVIHAAAIIHGNRHNIFQIKADEWSRLMDINLKGTFLINQVFAQLMINEKIQNGSIINFASITARLPFASLADYCASKAGVVSVTQSFAQELGPHNIRVNALGPNGTPSPMFDPLSEKVKDGCLKASLMCRLGDANEMARLCLFLASSESSYITGQTIYITGGG